MSVLIVDDQVTMCKSIQKMLRVMGYGRQQFTAHNGEDALTVLNKEEVDIILLDYNMPGMTGADLLGRIRENRKWRDLPVVMITAQSFGDYVAEAAESEIDAYLLKPLTTKLLGQKISLVVEKANNPSPMVFHLKKAVEYDEVGDLDGAVQEAEAAMKADPKSSKPIRDLGYYCYKKGDLKKAEKWLLKAAEMNHMDVFAFHHLGELYLKISDIEKAQHFFEKAMRISPRHLSRGINFGKTLVQMKKVKRAIQVFDEALQLSGSTPELREEIADYCIEAEVNAYASKLLESILRERPNRTDLYSKLGITHEAAGDTKKALGYLVKAEAIDEGDVEVKIRLATSYLKLKKPIWAEKALKRALKIEPKNEEAADLLKECVQAAAG